MIALIVVVGLPFIIATGVSFVILIADIQILRERVDRLEQRKTNDF